MIADQSKFMVHIWMCPVALVRWVREEKRLMRGAHPEGLRAPPS